MKKRLCLMFVFVVAGLNVGLAGELLEITGQVRDYETNPVQGADVAVYELHGDDYYSPRSPKLLDAIKKIDSEGRFVFSVTAEPYHDIYVIARKEGLALGWDYLHRDYDLFQKAENNLSIVLEKPYTLSGRLVDSDGKKVAGATIQLFTRIGGGGGILCEPKDWFSVKTDTQGRFKFDNLPIGLMAKFYVDVPQRDVVYIYPPQESTGNAVGGYHVDWEEIELKLPPTATLQGQVQDKHMNQGMANMDLILYTHQSSDVKWRFLSCAATSGMDGRFEIKGVPQGDHLLRLVSPKTGQGMYVGKNVFITVNRPGRVVSTRVVIERGTPLNVIIRDVTTGKTVPGCKLQMDDRWIDQQQDVFVQESRTDANGVAHLRVPQGHFKIHAWGSNWDDGTQFKGTEVTITGPAPLPVQILVKPTVPLVRGRVVDTKGQPAENVHIKVGLGQEVLTDEKGWFEGMQNPLYPSHMVVARDTEHNLVGANFFYDAAREQRLVLRPGSSIRGRVTDEQGNGVPGAEVSLGLECRRPGGQNGVYGSAHMATIRTDSEGYYHLDTVMPLKSGFTYRMTFTATEFSTARHTLTRTMKPGEDLVIPDMKLPRLDAFISGIVVDENDQPAPLKPVFIHSTELSSHCATTTDEQGRFKIKRIVEGPVTVQVGSYGGGSDAAFIWAHTGDHVRIKLGEHHKDYISPSSLVGRTLPDLSSLEIGLDSRQMKDKKTLVCFVDYTQHASQSVINSLNKRRSDMEQRNIAIVCVQVTPVDEDQFNAWRRDNKIRVPIAVLPGDAWWNDKKSPSVLKRSRDFTGILAEKWDVRSLPWMILTDENQTVIATGFELVRIYQLVPDPNPSILPRTGRRGR